MANRPPFDSSTPQAGLRIIGGTFRGRKLLYSGDRRTRPMKDRLREAVFNLLGVAVKNSHAIDLFAGTGALGLEALSRGAMRATFLEQHFPSAELIRQNIAALQVADRCEVVPGNVFIWAKRLPDFGGDPWSVFCSPPYAFFTERREEMLQLIRFLYENAPLKSHFVVEADANFDFGLLPLPDAWDVRSYPPAVVGIHEKIA